MTEPTPQQLEDEAHDLAHRVYGAAKMAKACWDTDPRAAADLGVPCRELASGFLTDPNVAWIRLAAHRVMPSAWRWEILETIGSAPRFVVLEYRPEPKR